MWCTDPKTACAQCTHHNITALENCKFQKLGAVLVVGEDSLDGVFLLPKFYMVVMDGGRGRVCCSRDGQPGVYWLSWHCFIWTAACALKNVWHHGIEAACPSWRKCDTKDHGERRHWHIHRCSSSLQMPWDPLVYSCLTLKCFHDDLESSSTSLGDFSSKRVDFLGGKKTEWREARFVHAQKHAAAV